MIWIVISVVLVVAALGLAHFAVSRWWTTGRPAVSTGLIYAAAVVTGAQLGTLAVLIDQANNHGLGLTDDMKAQSIVVSVTGQLADIAWQAGLLIAAALVVARLVTGVRIRVPVENPPQG